MWTVALQDTFDFFFMNLHLMRLLLMKKVWQLVFLSSLGFVAPSAHSIEEAGLITGTGKHANMTALIATVEAPWSWRESSEGRLHTYWQAYLSEWRGKGVGGQTIYGIGVAPVFRYSWNVKGTWKPYFEGAIGVHYFSDVRLSATKRMGTRFEFGDHLGFGFVLGQSSLLDIGYRYQHYSNASISKNNAGVNFHQLRLSTRF